MPEEPMKVITRFAPSPTGHLHLGGARTAIFNWLFTRHHKGKFYLRVEDTDTLRSEQKYTDSILASMTWLGLDWDGEPIYQSQRFDIYNKYIDKLLENKKAYWCSCTPEEVEQMREEAREKGEKPRYNGRCRERALGPGQGHVVRLCAPQNGVTKWNDMVKGELAFENSELDDMVLRKADGSPTYNLAVVVDDSEMGITHVLRGDDHVSNTPRQILIYHALELPLPTFGHVPMILGQDKQKLSKRHGATAVIDYQKEGLLPEALLNYLVLLGWSHGDDEIFSVKNLIDAFPDGKLNASPSAFDPEKLAWLNSEHMKNIPDSHLAELMEPFAKEEGLAIPEKDKLALMVHLLRERARTLKELASSIRFLLIPARSIVYDDTAKLKVVSEKSKDIIAGLFKKLEAVSDFEAEPLHTALASYVEECGLKFKDVGPALRLALVGSLSGPDLCQIMALLGKTESMARLAAFAKL